MSTPYESTRLDQGDGVPPLGSAQGVDATATVVVVQPPGQPVGVGAEDASSHPSDVKDQAKQAVADVAGDIKDQAAGVVSEAKAGGQQVTDVAKDEVRQVAEQAGQQAKAVMANARTELTYQVNTQQNRLAEVLRGLGEELGAMASGAPAPEGATGMVSDVAAQGAQRVQELAGFLADKDPQDVVDELTRFARRRPAAFLLAAGLTGLVAGRVTRSLRDERDQGDVRAQGQVRAQPRPVVQDVQAPERAL
jgi:uncharacterized protein YjbJ (UPF0337 family)